MNKLSLFDQLTIRLPISASTSVRRSAEAGAAAASASKSGLGGSWSSTGCLHRVAYIVLPTSWLATYSSVGGAELHPRLIERPSTEPHSTPALERLLPRSLRAKAGPRIHRTCRRIWNRRTHPGDFASQSRPLSWSSR